MEYWTEDGLSAIASGVGTPLYTDKITKAYSRMDYARVKVNPVPVAVYVQKHKSTIVDPRSREIEMAVPNADMEAEVAMSTTKSDNDYSGPGGRIWLAWNAVEVDVEILRVDIQKAYDSVNWDFILEALRIFNFPPRFIGWIEQCITTVTFSVSLNSSMHGFFQGSRGIRQGDPMSPYLLVIVMELWHVLLKTRVQNAATFQFHWKCKELGILNLCFADDVLIFCSGNTHSARIIKDTLAEFATMSGLHVNPNKSQIILSKAVQTERQAILDLLGFQEGSLPIK
ncbi:UNVERIFIED_CONTAM: hypothetical protein Slati_2464700 [Sesamum latifolium]|uniref:Reverse transcriptase domain-containing protein n=1 Tax=Sesamum latifolium TaxID=2727402 RepID=A0AAW2WHD6_9LAMI